MWTRAVLIIAVLAIGLIGAQQAIQHNMTQVKDVCAAGNFAVVNGTVAWVHGQYWRLNLTVPVIWINGEAYIMYGTLLGNYTIKACPKYP